MTSCDHVVSAVRFVEKYLFVLTAFAVNPVVPAARASQTEATVTFAVKTGFATFAFSPSDVSV